MLYRVFYKNILPVGNSPGRGDLISNDEFFADTILGFMYFMLNITLADIIVCFMIF